MGSSNFSVFLLILQEWMQNSIFPFLMVPIDYLGEERVFILYNFFYFHLGPYFPLSVLFSSITSIPQQYRVCYNVSNYFTWKFLNSCFYLTICMNFFTFIYFFSGVYRNGMTRKRHTWCRCNISSRVWVLVGKCYSQE